MKKYERNSLMQIIELLHTISALSANDLANVEVVLTEANKNPEILSSNEEKIDLVMKNVPKKVRDTIQEIQKLFQEARNEIQGGDITADAIKNELMKKIPEDSALITLNMLNNTAVLIDLLAAEKSDPYRDALVHTILLPLESFQTAITEKRNEVTGLNNEAKKIGSDKDREIAEYKMNNNYDALNKQLIDMIHASPKKPFPSPKTSNPNHMEMRHAPSGPAYENLKKTLDAHKNKITQIEKERKSAIDGVFTKVNAQREDMQRNLKEEINHEIVIETRNQETVNALTTACEDYKNHINEEIKNVGDYAADKNDANHLNRSEKTKLGILKYKKVDELKRVLDTPNLTPSKKLNLFKNKFDDGTLKLITQSRDSAGQKFLKVVASIALAITGVGAFFLPKVWEVEGKNFTDKVGTLFRKNKMKTHKENVQNPSKSPTTK